MKKITDVLTEYVSAAFEAAGYEASAGSVRASDRPDLCEFQCNGAMGLAKKYKKAPMDIAEAVASAMAADESLPFTASAVRPGFINIDLKPEFLSGRLCEMASLPDLGIMREETPKKIIVDYGGPNVAKPLHVGHLRAAVIGESIKRLCAAAGNEVLGDVHLGDFGLQMGLIIAEMQDRNPELPYFDENATEFPEEAPFTISELEEIYPTASERSKNDEAFREKALRATHDLQEGRAGYRALWEKITEISIADLKANYEKLDVHFELWKGESDVQEYIPDMVKAMKESGIAREDQGALIVDVALPEDKKEVPPCIILKSDGASLYSTTDLATLLEREKLYAPDEVIYVVDKRQSMHFLQVFRTARKAGIVRDETALTHVGFGTMNGRDGKPFKTRDGGVMRLETLLSDIEDAMCDKMSSNENVRSLDDKDTASKVALAAVKYGDLSNQASKDYVFDVDKFTSFEGNTGPYLLYTMVRIKSILAKADADAKDAGEILPPEGKEERALMLGISGFAEAIWEAYKEKAPHRLCAYLYALSNDFNRFYHETRILTETDPARKSSYLKLLGLTLAVMEKGIYLLGFSAPDKM